MSTKTLRKRIALVAVSALGAGLLSAISVAPAANAAAGDANAASAADKLKVATMASTTGSAVTLTEATLSAGRSVGLLYHNGGIGTTQTATMLNTGSLVLYVGTPSAAAAITVDGGTLSSGAGYVTSVNSNRTTATLTTTGTSSIVFTPNSGVTTATVSYYYGASVTLSNPTNGTLGGAMTITVSSASKSGVLSIADSYVKATNYTNTASESSPSSSADGTTTIANGGVGYIGVSLNDGYGDNYTANVLEASATNNVIVNWDSAPSSTTGTSTDVETSKNYAELQVKQGTANSNKPVTTVVTIKADGVVVATKTLTFVGDVASIKIYDVLISDLGAATAISTGATTGGTANIRAGAKFKLYDSAGNWVDEPNAVTYDSAKLDTQVSAVSVATASSATTETAGLVTWTCAAATSGKSTQALTVLNAANVTISQTFEAACGGDTDTFKVSTDKTTYAPGDIITVTISGFDVTGAVANDRHYVGGGTGTSAKNTLASGAFASAVDSPSDFDAYTNGKISYRQIAVQTEGTYNITVSVPSNDSGQASVTVPVTIKSASSSVTNAEVLAAIVKLIASINQQITALQKALKLKK